MLELFQRAGVVAWPLGLCSILALGIILERFYMLARLRVLEDRAFELLLAGLEKGRDDALNDPELAPAPVARVVDALGGMRGASEESIRQAAEIALATQRLRLRRYLGTLATIGSTSPF